MALIRMPFIKWHSVSTLGTIHLVSRGIYSPEIANNINRAYGTNSYAIYKMALCEHLRYDSSCIEGNLFPRNSAKRIILSYLR
jgi:hypothetical protein